MESSHNCGDAEECHSSESGWTMYIGSPINTDDDDDDDSRDDEDDNVGDYKEHNSVKHEDESDDSMASDASSGPSHRGHSWGNGKEHQVEKKGKKPVEKSGNARRKQEKEKSVFDAKGANVGTQSGGDKVRKNSWFGKRK
ncbi:hypothetical protein HYC85_030215 [Camellia sinensis]|uniref:Uncharacterized protein n=1 Tax=Camellia sinensis TaxID=4442 RepID=A0A7J7G3X9_CAMSI|nr:hypothetical protein HYC85_030215 [Camellia sinensis]